MESVPPTSSTGESALGHTDPPAGRRLRRMLVGGLVAVAMVLAALAGSYFLANPDSTLVEPFDESSTIPAKLAWPANIQDYRFVAPELQRTAEQFDALARDVYADLVHDNYDDVKRNVKAEAILARWYVADEQGFKIATTRSKSPARSASIHLSRNQDGLISHVTVIGDCRSAAGWTASVQYSPTINSRFHISLFGDRLPTNAAAVSTINLVNPRVHVGTRQSDEAVTVELETGLRNSRELARQPINAEALAPFFKSAESLRDESLRRIDQLETKVIAAIRSGTGFLETEWFEVRSDNPPRPMPRAAGPLSPKRLRICLQQAEERLEQRRKIIRTHYREFYEVITEAFPFYEAIGQP